MEVDIADEDADWGPGRDDNRFITCGLPGIQFILSKRLRTSEKYEEASKVTSLS